MDLSATMSYLNILPLSVLIAITGALAYYFGRIILSQRIAFIDRFNIYLEGSLFIAIYLLVPTIFGFFVVLWLKNLLINIGMVLTSVINVYLLLYLITKIYGILLKKIKWEDVARKILDDELKGKLKIKLNKNVVAKFFNKIYKPPSKPTLFITSIAIGITFAPSFFIKNIFLLMLNMVVVFILFTLVAFIYGNLGASFIPATIHLKDKEKVIGQITEITDEFIRVSDLKSYVYIIPLKEISKIKIQLDWVKKKRKLMEKGLGQ